VDGAEALRRILAMPLLERQPRSLRGAPKASDPASAEGDDDGRLRDASTLTASLTIRWYRYAPGSRAPLNQHATGNAV